MIDTTTRLANQKGVFNQYSPELINRKNETMSDTSLMTSIHKANIFDINFANLWQSISSKFETHDEDKVQGHAAIKENLKNSIRTNLFKLVEEIKPAHTKLYKITMENDY
jgi:hypothetical protein